MGTLNLFEAFNYYLLVVLVVGTAMRFANYRAILGCVFAFSHRWPKLLVLARRQKVVFLRWPTLIPVGSTLALMVLNTLAVHWVWSEATVTLADVRRHGLTFAIVLLTGGASLFLDVKAVFGFGRFDRAALERHLDKAEYWLRSWHSAVMRVLTLGLVDPRKLVGAEVQEALVHASLAVNGLMWRWSLQIAMRVAFGIALWTTWAGP